MKNLYYYRSERSGVSDNDTSDDVTSFQTYSKSQNEKCTCCSNELSIHVSDMSPNEYFLFIFTLSLPLFIDK